ncbi:hypothetical protein vseg_017384 [Gypsophila vaccaria]
MAGRYSRNNNYSQNNEDFDEGEMWGVFDDSNNNSNNNYKEMKINNIRKQPTNNNNITTTSPRNFTAVTTPRMIPKSSQVDCGGKKQSSAPLDIPDWSKIYGKSSRKTKNATSSSSSSRVINYPNDDNNNNNNNNNNNGCYYYNNGYNNNNSNSNNNNNNSNGYSNGNNGHYGRVGNNVDEDEDEDEDDIDGMVPPHEYLAKKLARNQISSFSVYEGIGRTLKGRDLSKVRNTILSKTGFLE